MKHWTTILLFATAWFATAASLAAGPADKKTDKTAYIGQPVSLVVQPDSIRLAGPRAMRQVLVTGRYSDGIERDLTGSCDFTAEKPDVVKILRGGLLRPTAAGETALVIEAGGQSARVPVVVADLDKPQPVGFRHEFIAAINVAGCNAGACHGIPSGRGGFKLSLRGYDPAADFLELTHSALGRRTNRFDAEASLILKKGLGLVAHAGGPRLLSANPIPQETFRAWLTEGLRDDPVELPLLTKVEVLPGSRVQIAPARWQQLAVLAHFADGSVRDVTRLTAFSSSDDSIAGVDANGLVELKQTGEAAILCRYLSVIECARLTYLEPQSGFVWSNPPEHNDVDRHVFAKLKMLNILPADLCTDEEFVRRAYLDLCGILPTPDECRAFLVDAAPDKRARLIEALLERPEFADLFTHKWLDVLRSNRLTIQIKGSHAYRLWLRSHIERNTPWNKVVSELLTASGSTFGNPPANYFRGPYDNGAPVVRNAQELAESTAQLFFGIRLQCAKCHNHPFERWTQDDYYHMVAWFSRLKAIPDTENPGSPPQPYPWQLRENALVIYSAPSGEATHPQSGKAMDPRVLGMPARDVSPRADRRAVLAELATSPENPYFARSTVNRLWYHLLGRGIVDPPDDFRDSNPSANDALLDALAREFVSSNFDVKHVIRLIANSRTYQLSSHAKAGNSPEAGNAGSGNLTDEKYFSHALVRRKRLTAELLLDAICAATGEPEAFTGLPEGTRAMQLPDGQVIYTGGRYASWDRHPFLKAFGQPAREAACECERESDLNMARALEMKNGEFVLGKIRAPNNRIGRLVAAKAPDADVLSELFLATLSRPPLPDEARASLDHVASAADKRTAWEDIQWALLNTNEFLFRH
ncbi:MAG: DUF1553 domain-containing protein [Planctomycetia bacterium]|nr:DUF1553 domain-containing protein [Planctomycetia bacterium]